MSRIDKIVVIVKNEVKVNINEKWYSRGGDAPHKGP